ncbi:MAG: TlpA disulfide reductase family protein [Steroidobacteraceae bacterium]
MTSRFGICSFAQAWLLGLCLLCAASSSAAEPVADFSMRTLSGEVIRLSEQRGNVVLLGFWARWCGDCRQAMQALDEINERYQRAGLLTLGINVGDSAEQAAAMSHSLSLRFPILLDMDQSTSSHFNLRSMPLIVLIDRDGELRYSHRGFSRGDEVAITTQLHTLLNN